MTAETGSPTYRGEEPPHDLLCREGYVLSHNAETKMPDWVLERLTPERFKGRAKRAQDMFKADPNLPPVRRSTPGDYRGSGFDKGHMAPAADMKFAMQAMIESFYMSNMSPQVGIGFNRHIWARLEDQMRIWAECLGTLVVVTGPIYGEAPKRMQGTDIPIPEAFYKVVYDPDRRRAIGFRLPNKRFDGFDLAPHVVAIRDIERDTGLNFLTALSSREQKRLESKRAALWRQECP